MASFTACKYLLSDRHRGGVRRSSPCIRFAKRHLRRLSRRAGLLELKAQAADLKPIIVWPEPCNKPDAGSTFGKQPAMIEVLDEARETEEIIIRIAGQMLQNWVDGGGRTVTPEMSLGLKDRRKPITLWRGCREYGFSSYDLWCEASRSAHWKENMMRNFGKPRRVQPEVPAFRAKPQPVDRVEPNNKQGGTWLF